MRLYLFLLMIFSLNLNIVLAGKIDEIFKDQTSIKDPISLRDPFQVPKFQSQGAKANKERFSGELDNQLKIEKTVNLDDIRIVGVLIGNERRVILNIAKEGPYTLKENDAIGINGPVLKAILPGGVILVEQINNIYGEPEYIETVIPISK